MPKAEKLLKKTQPTTISAASIYVNKPTRFISFSLETRRRKHRLPLSLGVVISTDNLGLSLAYVSMVIPLSSLFQTALPAHLSLSTGEQGGVGERPGASKLILYHPEIDTKQLTLDELKKNKK